MAQINDVVLIFFEDKPLSYARIEEISPDMKPGWYHVKLLLLQTPLQTVTWILRNAYIDGTEFTMGGKRMRIEPVVAPGEPAKPETEKPAELPQRSGPAKVISLADMKKKVTEPN
jgi:hypothetical protein